MNQIIEQKPGSTAVSIATDGSGSKIAPQNLGEVIKFAEVMCKADIALPKHLRGNAGACMAVAMQALEWEMSPFAVASKSYQVNGAIAYEAQLIVAVVNTRSGIEGRLKYAFEGEGADRICICTGKLDGEILEVRSPKFKDITPKNSPLWKSDPDQQQCYYTGRTWARRHTPEVILGVYDREEVQAFQGADNAKDVTPSLTGRLKAAQEATEQPTGAREGFSEGFAHSETRTLSGDDESVDPDTGEITDNTDGEATGSSSVTEAEPDAPTSSQAGASAGEDSSSSQSSPATNEVDKELLIKTAQLLWASKGPDPDVVDRQAATLKDDYAAANEVTKKSATGIKTQIKMLGAGEIEAGECIEYLAGIIGVEPAELGLTID